MNPRHKYLFPLSLALIGFILSFLYSVDGDSLKPPIVHDEYAYILGANTFLEGRLSNPTPAHWQHFEAFHILMTPRYMSKYPPGQSLQLAVGKILGHYLIGVWLTVALIGALLYWLLRSYTSPWLAWLITFAYLIQINEAEWGSNYWGGSLLTLEGILVFGGFLWMLRRPRLSYAFIIGIGMILMINTRPFEAFFFFLSVSIPVVAILLWKKPFSPKIKTGAAIVCISGVIGIGLSGLYNYKTTGDALTFPHQLYTEQYLSGLPIFTISDRKETRDITSMHPDMHNFLVTERERNIDFRFKIYAWITDPQLFFIGKFFLLNATFILLPLLIWRPKDKLPLIALCGISFIGYSSALLLSTYQMAHYYALWLPPCALLSALSIQCILKAKLNRLITAPFQTRVGLVLIFGTIFIQNGYSLWLNTLSTKTHSNAKRFNTQYIMEKELLATKQNFLCLVQYTHQHNPHLSWIHNQINIDESQVIWARSISKSADAELLKSYPNREILYFFVNQHKYRLLSAQEFYNPNLQVLKHQPLSP